MTKTGNYEKATFAGGCFWCMVQPFDELEGIISITSGYTGGHVDDPSYEEVKTGETGHYEAVQIEFNPSLFPYEKLLRLYWPQIDPTDDGGQFQDRGPQYRTAVFYHNADQEASAQQSKKDMEQSGKFSQPVVTEIKPASAFYPAEDYHQNFYKTHEKEYKEDRKQSGRDEFIQSHWQ